LTFTLDTVKIKMNYNLRAKLGEPNDAKLQGLLKDSQLHKCNWLLVYIIIYMENIDIMCEYVKIKYGKIRGT